VVRPVAAADAEDVDLEALEVFGDAIKLVERVGLADDACVPERLRETPRRARIAAILGSRCNLAKDDADAGHRIFLPVRRSCVNLREVAP